jgi:NTP pyrophosphatase (non-canonical NTP hydrolase)
MSQELRDARLAIASEIDQTYFHPPAEKRLDPATLILTLAGILLYEFAKAMAKKIGSKLGDAAGDEIASEIARLIQSLKQGDTVDYDLDAATQELAQAIARHNPNREELEALANYIQRVVEIALTREGYPTEKAQRLASSVRSHVERNIKT